MEKIDIVVTYLNERDEKWQQDYNYWKDKEVKEHKNQLSNRQAFGEERIREWDTFKYWFRGVEENCSWVNKVFLIVQNERHIPEWLDRNNSKLRIVYHDEFIPKDILPTFNPMIMLMYVANIEDLADNYIICDDDFYFLNKIEEDRFFKDNKPVHIDNKIPYRLYETNGTDGIFYEALNNSLKFEARFNPKRIKYGFYHLPSSRKKSFEKEILTKYGKEIKYHCSFSKFRHKTNLCPTMYDDLLKLCNKVIYGEPYKNSCYCDLNSKVNFDDYLDKDMVCFNDTERLDDYEKTKEKWIEFLEKKLPNKCSFEKE